jgi:hypothetical protein
MNSIATRRTRSAVPDMKLQGSRSRARKRRQVVRRGNARDGRGVAGPTPQWTAKSWISSGGSCRTAAISSNDASRPKRTRLPERSHPVSKRARCYAACRQMRICTSFSATWRTMLMQTGQLHDCRNGHVSAEQRPGDMSAPIGGGFREPGRHFAPDVAAAESKPASAFSSLSRRHKHRRRWPSATAR